MSTTNHLEEQERVYFDHSPAASFIVSSQGKCLDVNNAACKLLGYSNEEIRAKYFHDLVLKGGDGEIKLIYESLENTDHLAKEIELVQKGGAQLHVTIKVIRLSPIKQLFYCTPTGDVENKNNIPDSDKSVFYQLSQNINEVFWLISSDWNKVLYISPAYETKWGKSAKSLYENPKEWIDAVHPDDVEQVLADIPKNLDTVKGAVKFKEYRIIGKDEQIIWISATAFPIYNNEGKVERFAGVSTDITSTMQTELALKSFVESTSSYVGAAFFDNLILELSKTLNADFVFIGELGESPKKTIRTIATAGHGKLIDNFEYDLEKTPCENVFGLDVCAYPSGVADLFPDDELLKQMCIDAYVGVPLFDSKKNPVGILVALFKYSIDNVMFKEAFLRTFSLRISSELERIENDKAIVRNEERMKLILESTNAGEWDWNITTGDVYFSPLWWQSLGYKKEEASFNIDFFEKSVHPDDFDGLQEKLQAHFEGKTDSYEFEYRIRHKNGEYHWSLDKGKVVERDAEGNPVRMVGVDTNISTRKNAELALQESERKFRAFTNQSVDGISVANLDGKYIFANPAFCTMMGWTEKEMLTKTVFDMLSDKQHDTLFEKVKEEKKSGIEVVKLVRKDKSEFIAEIVGSDITIGGEKGVLGAVRDVTEREKTEEEVRKSEMRLSNAQHIAQIGSWEYDLISNALYWSDEVFKLFDFDPQIHTPTYEGFLNGIHPDDRKLVDDAYTESLELKVPYDINHRLLLQSGEIKYVNERCETLYNQEGVPILSIGTIQDITQQKEKELQLRSSEYLLANSQKIAGIGSYQLDMSKGTWESSIILNSIFGIETDYEKTNESWLQIVHPDDQLVMQDYFENHIVKNKKHFDKKYRITRICDNEVRWVHGLGELEFSNDNTPIQMIGTIQDITQQKEVENELRKLSTAIEQSPAVVVMTDANGIIDYVNPKFEIVTGYTADEAVGRNPKFLQGGETSREVYKELWATILAGGTWQGIFHNKKKNGELYWEETTISAIFDKQGNITNFISLKEDITLQKQTEKELQKMEKLQSIGTLAGGIAHDFNNILTGIVANISVVKDYMADEDDTQKFIEDSEKAIERAKKLTNQLLTFSKGGVPVKSTAKLSDLLTEVINFDLAGSNVKSVTDMPDNLWVAQVDKGQIQQVFSNLIINANQAMPNGGHIYVSMENCSVQDGFVLQLELGDYIKITIKDEGAGIDPDDIDKIFEPYYTAKTGGTGLGLATTYSIISKHGGTIEVTSSIDEGATFTIYLPASKTLQMEEQEVAKPTPISVKTAKRILVMDDVQMLLDVMKSILESKGYLVETAENGEKAIALYTASLAGKNPFDAVIMDLTIPGGMGGKDAINGILKTDPEANCIVTSGYAVDPVIANYERYGFKGMIPKPFNKDDLLNELRRVLQE